MNGVLVIDKPSGMTSHDVVNVVRRLLHTRRVGHTGTLDPMATGVLVLVVGWATRLSRFVMASDKSYHAVIRLGETTTTYDAEGEIVDRHPVAADLDTLREALAAFEGTIEQIPPMYAAIKVGGKKLYELAREGKEIERKARTVTIYDIDLLAWEPPDLTIEVTCSTGTYIRSLAHDLGQRLGCGGHLIALRRTRSGTFTLEDSHTLDDLERRHQDQLPNVLLPPREALRSMPAVTLSPGEALAIRYGQQVRLDQVAAAELVQAQDEAGRLVAVLRRQNDVYQPKVVLPPPHDEVASE